MLRGAHAHLWRLPTYQSAPIAGRSRAIAPGAWAPRSTGVLWVRPELQAALHPAVISWGLDQGFTTEFDLVGTRDPSAWLAAPAALELLAEFGAEEVRRYNHELAFEAGERLAKRWGTEFRTPRSMVASMVSVPLPERFGGSPAEAARLRDVLLFEERICLLYTSPSPRD